MVEITVILVTKRLEPRLDWALESLKTQTYKDFEYIIVDGLYNDRKDRFKELIKKSSINFSFLYIPDKPSRWKGKRPAISNARNTGLVFAKGKYVVWHDDCCKMPPEWLQKHIEWLEKGYIVSGNWINYQKIDENGKGIIGHYGWEYRSSIIKSPQVVHFAWLYGANMSFNTSIAKDINGFDEYLDGEMGQDDIDFSIRANRRGYHVMYDPSCYVEYFLPTHGLLMRYGTEFWRDQPIEMDISPVNRILKDGKEHSSNELAIQELLDDKNRYTPRGNIIDIRNARKTAKSHSKEQVFEMMEGWIDKNPYDWRDGKLISEKIKD